MSPAFALLSVNIVSTLHVEHAGQGLQSLIQHFQYTFWSTKLRFQKVLWRVIALSLSRFRPRELGLPAATSHRSVLAARRGSIAGWRVEEGSMQRFLSKVRFQLSRNKQSKSQQVMKLSWDTLGSAWGLNASLLYRQTYSQYSPILCMKPSGFPLDSQKLAPQFSGHTARIKVQIVDSKALGCQEQSV